MTSTDFSWTFRLISRPFRLSIADRIGTIHGVSENSYKDRLHHRPRLKLAQYPGPYDACRHGRCQDQLLTRKLRGASEEHQDDPQGQPEPSSTDCDPPGSAGTEAQSRKTRH